MKSQRLLIFSYIAVFLGFFYLKFILVLKNERNPINSKRLNSLKNSQTRVFDNKFIIYHDNFHSSKNVSLKLHEFITANNFSSSILNVESYDSDYLSDDLTHSNFDDVIRLDRSFVILVYQHDDRSSHSRDHAVFDDTLAKELHFNLTVKGGNTLVFTLFRNFSYSVEVAERMFSMVKQLFINYDFKKLKSSLDLNFLLVSSDLRVSWDFNKIMNDYLNNVLSCFSLFYDANLHSKVVSNVDLFSKLTTTTEMTDSTLLSPDGFDNFDSDEDYPYEYDYDSSPDDYDLPDRFDELEGQEDPDLAEDADFNEHSDSPDQVDEEAGSDSELNEPAETNAEEANDDEADSTADNSSESASNEDNNPDAESGEHDASGANSEEAGNATQVAKRPDTQLTRPPKGEVAPVANEQAPKRPGTQVAKRSATHVAKFSNAKGAKAKPPKQPKTKFTKLSKYLKNNTKFGKPKAAKVETATVELNTTFYNFFEALSNVDISLKDNHFYRNSLNFFLVLTDKPAFIRDPLTEERRRSFTIENLGIFLFSTLAELGPRGRAAPGGEPYVLSEGELVRAIASWATHVRRYFALPASKSEFAISLARPDESLRLRAEDFFVLSSKSADLRFGLSFHDPVGLAFYGFEITRIAKSLFHAYVRATFESLSKVVELTRISYNTQVPKSTVLHNALDALEYLTGRSELEDTYLNKMDRNQRLLVMAKYAFLESLDALSDDEMYNKNVLSYEHQLAVFMCDVFPFAFPVLMFVLKFILGNLRRK